MPSYRKITLHLNQEEINSFANELEKMAEKLEKAQEKIVDDIAEVGLQEMQKEYANAGYEPMDGMGFSKTGTKDEKKISMIGSQAAYMEFGTGTYGEMYPDPQKDDFDLNPYNSGKTIRAAKGSKKKSIARQLGIPKGGLYWTYKDENGVIHYTQGVPAQKIVYDTAKKIREKMPTICKEAIEGVFK